MEGAVSASTGGSAVAAKSVEEVASASTGGSAVTARSAEGPASVSTVGGAVGARSAAGAASVSMGGGALNARSVEAAVSVSMAGGAVDARSVEAAVFVSTAGSAIGARSVQRLSHQWRHTFVKGWNQTRQMKRILARWPAMVDAKASGADTISRSWTGTKTHLQKMVCDTPTRQFRNALPICALCLVL